jgi:hypothetical protein
MRHLEKHIAAIFIFISTLAPVEGKEDWRQLYESLKTPRLADSSWTITDTLTIQLPDFSLQMFSGVLAALHAADSVTGWVFEGDGQARFAPRHHLEQQQLKRFVGDTILVCPIRQFVMRYAATSSRIANAQDQHESFLSPLHPFTPSPSLSLAAKKYDDHSLSDEAMQLNERLHSQLLLRRGYNFSSRLLVDHLLSQKSDFAICAFVPSSLTDFSAPLYIYLFDPLFRESIKFYQFFEQRSGSPFYLLCSYGSNDLYHVSSDSIKPLTPFVTKYNGWVETRPSGEMWIDMGCDLFMNNEPLPALQFDIAPEFTIQKIRDADGDSIAFIQEPGEAVFTVVNPAPTAVDTLRLLISYQGRGLDETAAGNFYLQDPIYWLPRLGYLRRAIHKIIVKYPDGARIVGMGKASAPWRDRSHTLKYFNADTPARVFAFAFGKFINDSLRINDRLSAQVYSTTAHTATARQTVMNDIKASLEFFQTRLGSYPLPQLDVLEAPGMDSQGLPGLVMLTWVSFRSNVAGVMQMLRGHEVAHQWFGNTVGWATYHDQWLAEGVTEYLGATFMESQAGGEKYFEQVLNAWRDDLLSERLPATSSSLQRFGLPPATLAKSEGKAAGPIWMGIRLGEKQGVDYYLYTYEKGAWIMHMLRRLLTDDATGSDAAFWKMLAGFCTTYAQKDPTTFDFQKVVERHIGMTMDWFFRQWVLGTEIPGYAWNVTTEKIGEQNFLVRGVIRQKETSADFRMLIPLAFELGKNQRHIERVWVSGHETAFEFHLPQKPKKIIFNYKMAVLCHEEKKNLPIH